MRSYRISPKLTYKENGDPGEADVVEGDGPAERVDFSGLAVGVVQVPVDAVGLVEEARLEVGHALDALLVDERRQQVALVHAGAVLRGTDELLLGVVFVVQRVQLASETQGHQFQGGSKAHLSRVIFLSKTICFLA